MKRKLICIDTARCNGCGLCAGACHEGAIAIVDGKARLLREDYCDGLGDCLPACPTGAISFAEREAPAYDAAAVKRHLKTRPAQEAAAPQPSELTNWPVQLKLCAVNAPWLRDAELLIAADCTAVARGRFHRDYIRGRAVLIACPKLDGTDYSEKLADIFRAAAPKSITVTRMQVPCCGGLPYMVEKALAASGHSCPLTVITIAPDGSILNQERK